MHRYILAPALETMSLGDWPGAEIDGELYWSPGRRGDVPGVCGCGLRRCFHPFRQASPNETEGQRSALDPLAYLVAP